MTVNEYSIILLTIAVSFGIAGISFQLMRLIGSVADSVKDFRKTIQNLGDLSTKLTEDYDHVSNGVKSLSDALGNLGNNVVNPVVNALSFLKRFKRK